MVFVFALARSASVVCGFRVFTIYVVICGIVAERGCGGVSCCSLSVAVSFLFFFSSRRRHTRSDRDWSSDVCSSDLAADYGAVLVDAATFRLPLDVMAVTVSVVSNHVRASQVPLDPALLKVLHRQREEIGRASCRERV